jgi:hypothetical protein
LPFLPSHSSLETSLSIWKTRKARKLPQTSTCTTQSPSNQWIETTSRKT